jgi:hypothetical protein
MGVLIEDDEGGRAGAAHRGRSRQGLDLGAQTGERDRADIHQARWFPGRESLVDEGHLRQELVRVVLALADEQDALAWLSDSGPEGEDRGQPGDTELAGLEGDAAREGGPQGEEPHLPRPGDLAEAKVAAVHTRDDGMAGERLDVGQDGGALAIGQGPFGLRRQGPQRERPAGILGRQAIEAHRPAPATSLSASGSASGHPELGGQASSRRMSMRMVSR